MSDGHTFTALAMQKGVFIVWGLNTVYGHLANGADWMQAQLRYTYDMPPTCNITYPASGGTISDSPAPIVTWDYFDDFQPQSRFRAIITNTGTQAIVADSGIVVSSNTFWDAPNNLPNGNYRVDVLVYQAWDDEATSGLFPALAYASSTFTVAVLQPGTPRIAAANIGEHVELTVYPDVNLLDYDASSFDRSALSWSELTNCTVSTSGAPLLDGTSSGRVNITATASAAAGHRKFGVPAIPGLSYKAKVSYDPLALSGRQGRISIKFFDSSWTQLQYGTVGYTTLTINSWNACTITNQIAPANTAWVEVVLEFATTTAGDNIYVDDVGLWHEAGTTSFPAWSRGGFFETTPNLLSYADSSFETDDWIWQQDPGQTTTTSVVSQTQKAHGLQSLRINKTAAGTGNVGLRLGDGTAYLPVTPNTIYNFFWSVGGSVAGKTSGFGMQWYDANYGFISGVYSTAAVTTSQASHLGTLTSPSNAAFGIPILNIANAIFGENYYFDALSITPPPAYNSYWQGAFPATDTAPTVLIEYSDDAGLTWITLSEFLTTINVDNYAVEDYTIKSNVQRQYRVSLYEIENSLQLQSQYSSIASATLVLSHVWMHIVGQEAATSWNFVYDGGGRTRVIGAQPALVPVEGSPYPFAQFGVQNTGQIQVSLHLDNQADINALEGMALSKALVSFRDQRGRCAIGTIGDLSVDDATYGVAEEAKFTLQLAGIQP
jgi:hypothetical protein